MSNFEDVISRVGRSDPIILDVGANNGDQTNMFLEHFPQGQVFSFEPEPRAIAQFRRRVTNPRAILIEQAVGGEVGRQVFHQSSGVHPDQREEDTPLGWDQSGSIKRPAYHLVAAPWVKFDSTIEVDVTTLDTWSAAENPGEIDLIWADVQGAEEEMIRGAVKTLTRTRLLYTEYSNVEMYQGQINLRSILQMLPAFELVRDYNGDVLLANTRL